MPNFNSMEALCEPEVYIPYRKHSSGDLQSRLKTRKILGVGETDNGDVHRSKISQVLGHNEHLFVRLPRCYWLWHFMIACIFTINGSCKFCPFIDYPRNTSEPEEFLQYRKFHGSTLLGFSLIMWRLLGTTDKSLARALMSAVIATQLAQICTFFEFVYENKWNDERSLNVYLSMFLILGCVYFFWAIGSSRAGLRRSLSNKDLRDRQPTPDEQHSPSSPRQHQPGADLKKEE